MRPSNRSYKRMPVAALAVVAVLAAACGKSSNSPSSSAASGGSSVSLTGAGSTFVQPAMLQWISKYKAIKPNVGINYQGIGSGGGITQLTNQTIDFADSDAFMSDAEIAAAKAKRNCGVVHVPMVFGAVSIVYNVKGLSSLTLDGPTLADIFLGKVKTYDDQEIKNLNPGARLPSTPIRIVHRSDDSGTTKIFTTYLSSISPQWKTQVGAHKGSGDGLKWPTGGQGQGNDGVAAQVQQNDGGLGYVELSYALNAKLSMAKLKNKDGNGVTPSIASTQAAVQSLQIPDDLRFNVLGVGGSGYPIVGATWVIAYDCGYSAAKATALKDFLTWVLNNGNGVAQQLNYAPLFPALKTKALANVTKINASS